MYDVLIIGGGASGLIAACALALRGRRVVLLEKQARVGRKLLSTGNGRCNLTNLRAGAGDYHGARQAAQAALRAWPPKRVLGFFEGIGIPCSADEAGRVYPMSHQAASVLDALRLCCDENGVETRVDFRVVKLEKRGKDFTAMSDDGQAVSGRCALVCTGGLAAPKLGACGDGYRLLEALGHRIAPRFAAIAALKTSPEPVRISTPASAQPSRSASSTEAAWRLIGYTRPASSATQGMPRLLNQSMTFFGGQARNAAWAACREPW